MIEKGKELRTLRIISGALIGALLAFLAVAVFLHQALHPTGLTVVSYFACCWAIASVPIADMFRSSRWPTTTPEQDRGYWQKRISAHLASMGIVEGAAFFCCVSLIVGTLWWPLAALLVPLGAMLAWFPREP